MWKDYIQYIEDNLIILGLIAIAIIVIYAKFDGATAGNILSAIVGGLSGALKGKTGGGNGPPK